MIRRYVWVDLVDVPKPKPPIRVRPWPLVAQDPWEHTDEHAIRLRVLRDAPTAKFPVYRRGAR